MFIYIEEVSILFYVNTPNQTTYYFNIARPSSILKANCLKGGGARPLSRHVHIVHKV